jgi:hypothetical protein
MKSILPLIAILLVGAVNPSPAADAEEGFVTIFDGKRIPNADYLERTGRCVPHGPRDLSARLWRLPPKSANTPHIRACEIH